MTEAEAIEDHSDRRRANPDPFMIPADLRV
jgi:hypothetical protein